MWLKKHISTVVLILILLITICNKYLIEDVDLQWSVAMKGIALYLTLYSFNVFLQHRSMLNLTVCIIFLTELAAVLMGWNLATQFYPEFISLLCFAGIFQLIRKWVR